MFFREIQEKPSVLKETQEKPSVLKEGFVLQVNVIRTVEVEIENKIKDLKDGAKDESSKHKQFQRKVADLHKEMASLSPDGKNKHCVYLFTLQTTLMWHNLMIQVQFVT